MARLVFILFLLWTLPIHAEIFLEKYEKVKDSQSFKTHLWGVFVPRRCPSIDRRMPDGTHLGEGRC